MTKMTGPDCAVMCNLINTHTHTHTAAAAAPSKARHISAATPWSWGVSLMPPPGGTFYPLAEGGGVGGDGSVGQREQCEGPLATQPDSEIELSHINRGVGGVCVAVAPRFRSKLSLALHAHRGKKLL